MEGFKVLGSILAFKEVYTIVRYACTPLNPKTPRRALGTCTIFWQLVR